MDPIRNCGVGNWPDCGRDYTKYASTFDYEGDKPALKLIKRIDFYIPENGLSSAQIPVVNKYRLTDFLVLITHWLKSFSGSIDANNDGIINAKDLGKIMSNWE